MAKKFKSAVMAYQYMIGGSAYATFRSEKTDEHLTFELRVKRPRDRKGKLIPMKDVDTSTLPIWISAKQGHDYRYFGYLAAKTREYKRASDAKTKLSFETTSVKAFEWALPRLAAGLMPTDLSVWHNGRCGRCQRKLTVPVSIETGFGPDCMKILGIQPVEV